MPLPPPATVREAPKIDRVHRAAVRFEGVVKGFDGVTAVDGLDLDVHPGSVYGLLGPNGAGKTTSIRMLMGILGADEGRIRVLGHAPSDATKDRIGYLPEERGLYPSMKVLDNLVFFAGLRGMRPEPARDAALRWLDRIVLPDVAGRRLQELSKGNQQKVQFVATVMHDPDLLVLDEPFSGLDPVNQDRMRDTILALAGNGTTIILSTHRMDEVERLCSHLTLIHAGRSVAEGSLADVKRIHGGESVHLEVEGDSAFVDSLPEVRSVRRIGRKLEIRLTEDADASELLGRVASRARVRHFDIRVESLHSIFVRLVTPESVPAAQEVRS